MISPEPLRTELPDDIRERVEEMAHSPRPHQIPIEESRRLKRESLEERTTDPQPVGRTTEFGVAGPTGDTLPIRIYVPDGSGPFPIVVWFHGGGFVRGGLEGTDTLARYLTNRLEASVVVVDYRLAPENEFPAALLDCYTATSWVEENAQVVHGDPDRLAVGGTSAGGNLAAATALLARDRGGPAISHQFLGMPMLDAACDTRAHEENAEGYGLSTAGLRYYWDAYLRSDVDEANAYACPGRARDLTGLPPTTVVTAGFDPLRDEGIEYANRLEGADVTLEHYHFPALPHHLSKFLRQGLEPAVAAWDEIAAGLRESLHAASTER